MPSSAFVCGSEKAVRFRAAAYKKQCVNQHYCFYPLPQKLRHRGRQDGSVVEVLVTRPIVLSLIPGPTGKRK